MKNKFEFRPSDVEDKDQIAKDIVAFVKHAKTTVVSNFNVEVEPREIVGYINGERVFKKNEIKLIVDLEMTPDDVLRQMKPEYQQQLRRKEIQKQDAEYQEIYDGVLLQLYTLDLRNIREVLFWCMRLTKVTNSRIQKRESNEVLAFLKQFGYEPDQLIGEVYENNEENNARYIIGQVLAGVRDDCINERILYTYLKEWIHRFKK